MADKTLPLYATGNPNPIPVPGQPPQQAPLAFAPMPQQPPGSELLGILSSLAGLGLNIAGAATRTGAAGQGTLAFGQQQLDQSAKNSKLSQDASNDEKEAEALVKRAKAAGVGGAALEQITALAQNRQVVAGRTELDRELSLMRQRDAQAKQEKAISLAMALQEKRNLDEQLKTHPGAVESFLSDFADKVQDRDMPGNIAAKLQTEGRKQGIRIDAKAAQQYAKTLSGARDAAVASRRTGGFLGLFQSDAPKEQHKTVRQMLEGSLDANAIGEYKNLSSVHQELKKALPLLRAKPGSKEYQQGTEILRKLQEGQIPQQQEAPRAPQGDGRIRVQDLQSGQTGSIPAAEFDASKYKKL